MRANPVATRCGISRHGPLMNESRIDAGLRKTPNTTMLSEVIALRTDEGKVGVRPDRSAHFKGSELMKN